MDNGVGAGIIVLLIGLSLLALLGLSVLVDIRGELRKKHR